MIDPLTLENHKCDHCRPHDFLNSDKIYDNKFHAPDVYAFIIFCQDNFSQNIVSSETVPKV